MAERAFVPGASQQKQNRETKIQKAKRVPQKVAAWRQAQWAKRADVRNSGEGEGTGDDGAEVEEEAGALVVDEARRAIKEASKKRRKGSADAGADDAEAKKVKKAKKTRKLSADAGADDAETAKSATKKVKKQRKGSADAGADDAEAKKVKKAKKTKRNK